MVPDNAESSPEDDDFGLQDLVPQYLALCRRDLLAMQSALERLDFDRVRVLGHNLKGSGSAYGFPRLTDLGASVEQAAKSNDNDTIRVGITELEAFLDSKNA